MSTLAESNKRKFASFLLRNHARELGQRPIPKEGLSIEYLQETHKALLADVRHVFPEVGEGGVLRDGLNPNDLEAALKDIGNGIDPKQGGKSDSQKIAQVIGVLGTMQPFGTYASNKFAEVIGQQMATSLGIKLNRVHAAGLEDALRSAKQGRTAQLAGLIIDAVEHAPSLAQDVVPLLKGSSVVGAPVIVNFDSSQIKLGAFSSKLDKLNDELSQNKPSSDMGLRQ